MSEQTTLLISELRAAVCQVLDEVARRHGDEVDLGVDLYRVLPAERTYDVGVDLPPDVHTTGSLIDDLGTVRELTTSTGRGGADVVVWHDLAHLVGILQRLAAMDRP